VPPGAVAGRMIKNGKLFIALLSSLNISSLMRVSGNPKSKYSWA
jgi:hypothetical protein